MLSVPLSRIVEIVCAFYQIERAELSRRGSRHPARAALVYLARNHTLATNAELARKLGLTRAESVPNLTRRFSDWLSTDAKIRKHLRDMEAVLQGPSPV
jgi:chromosomal replication initiation ATPase DnaA